MLDLEDRVQETFEEDRNQEAHLQEVLLLKGHLRDDTLLEHRWIKLHQEGRWARTWGWDLEKTGVYMVTAIAYLHNYQGGEVHT